MALGKGFRGPVAKFIAYFLIFCAFASLMQFLGMYYAYPRKFGDAETLIRAAIFGFGVPTAMLIAIYLLKKALWLISDVIERFNRKS